MNQTITLRLRSSSSENQQAARIIIDANGNRAVHFIQNQTDGDNVLVYSNNTSKLLCTGTIDAFDAIWRQLRNKSPSWQWVDSELQEATVQANIPVLSSLCSRSR